MMMMMIISWYYALYLFTKELICRECLQQSYFKPFPVFK